MGIWWDQNSSPNYRKDGWFAIHPETQFAPGTAISAAWANEDHLDLFAVTDSGAVVSIWWDRDNGYRPEGWLVIHPETRFSPGTEVTALWANSDHLDLFAVDVDGVVRTIWWDTDGGYRADGWLSIHPETRTVPAGHLRHFGRIPITWIYFSSRPTTPFRASGGIVMAAIAWMAGLRLAANASSFRDPSWRRYGHRPKTSTIWIGSWLTRMGTCEVPGGTRRKTRDTALRVGSRSSAKTIFSTLEE